ncbi:YcaO-like family protein [Mammaliicoccus sciuri]|uniref:YcaO-like family protein n=1 Tax=Mammaliicoccus sciuri TaxID=1296 RepID=UPI003F5523DC
MIFSSEKNRNFNIPSRIFLNNYFYSFSKNGSFKINNVTGPDGGNSISNNKNMVIRKSYSEMLERRLLMPGTEDFQNKIVGIDIISGNIEYFYEGYIKYCNLLNFENDTTGTASHFNSELAILNAIRELFEKNSLFLFWFKQRGYKITNVKKYISMYFLEKYKNLYIFINDDLSPFICCTIFAINENKIIANGSGSNFSVEASIKSALEELDLLYEQHKINKLYTYMKDNISIEYSSDDKAQIAYIHKLYVKLPEYNFTEGSIEKNVDGLINVIKNIPPWISNIYVINISRQMQKNVKTVRLYSDDLNNYIPRKILSYRSNTINKQFVPKFDLKDTIPECPIL